MSFPREYKCITCGKWFKSIRRALFCDEVCQHLSWGLDLDNITVESRKVKKKKKPSTNPRSKYKFKAERRIIEEVHETIQFRCISCGDWHTDNPAGNRLYCSVSCQVYSQNEYIGKNLKPPFATVHGGTRRWTAVGRPLRKKKE